MMSETPRLGFGLSLVALCKATMNRDTANPPLLGGSEYFSGRLPGGGLR